MKTSEFARLELNAMAETARLLGPTSVTLCPQWDAADLLEHVLVRTSGASGFLLSAMGINFYLKAYMRSNQTRWDSLLESAARHRPSSRWHDLVEILVHHEDLRRSDPYWKEREYSIPRQEIVMSLLTRAYARRGRGRVVLSCHCVDSEVEAVLSVSHDGQYEEISGRPTEVLQYIYGRPANIQARRSELLGGGRSDDTKPE